MNFWGDNPTLLFDSRYIQEIWIYDGMDRNQSLNALSRLIIVLSVIGFACFNRILFLVIGGILLGCIVLFHHSQKENFETELSDYQRIDQSNPMNNVLMQDYKYNPMKTAEPKDYGEQKEKSINDKTKQFILQENKSNSQIGDLFKNKGDQFQFEQSLRPFHTNPVTTVDQSEYKDFLKYCYGVLPSDKPLRIF
jgi:hypothetical protein|uniref:Minor capsid protein P9 transmembrane helices domain-containing protein n=1 Tax=viral metagenome TaxID=1070528 RepID=A0A6C0HMV7_9ZZZZ